MMKTKRVYVIDINKKTFGVLGLLFFGIACTVALLCSIFYDSTVMLIAALMFLLGGAVGRIIEKRSKEDKGETIKNV